MLAVHSLVYLNSAGVREVDLQEEGDGWPRHLFRDMGTGGGVGYTLIPNYGLTSHSTCRRRVDINSDSHVGHARWHLQEKDFRRT